MSEMRQGYIYTSIITFIFVSPHNVIFSMSRIYLWQINKETSGMASKDFLHFFNFGWLQLEIKRLPLPLFQMNQINADYELRLTWMSRVKIMVGWLESPWTISFTIFFGYFVSWFWVIMRWEMKAITSPEMAYMGKLVLYIHFDNYLSYKCVNWSKYNLRFFKVHFKCSNICSQIKLKN